MNFIRNISLALLTIVLFFILSSIFIVFLFSKDWFFWRFNADFIGGGFSKYKGDIYYVDNSRIKMDEADYDSFESLNKESRYGKDVSNIYYGDRIIKEADSETFEVFENCVNYARDKNNFYYNSWIIEGNYDKLEFLNDCLYMKDDEYIYIRGGREDNIDYDSFKTFDKSPHYFKDKNNIYYWMALTEIVEGADLETFEPISEGYAKDKDSVFMSWMKITGADPETIEYVGEGSYVKDKNHCYFGGDIVEMSECEKIEKQSK